MYASNPNSYGSLEGARKILSQNGAARDQILDCLASIEKKLQNGSAVNVREEVTGPIADLLFESGELLTRKISNGMSFSFRYSSKIARDFMMARQTPLDHVWEPQTTKAVVALSKGAKNVIVGGAYIGDHSLLIARSMARDGVCHCFELSDDSLEMLRMNLKNNHISNVKINQLALWSVDGVKIELAGEDSHASPQIADKDTTAPHFVSSSIDNYAQKNKLDQIDVVMLDIEGGEFEALLGAKSVMARPVASAPAIICEIHAAYVDWSAGLRTTPLCQLMIDNGYEIFAIRDYQGNDPSAGEIVELVDIDSAVISGPKHGFNLLAVKSRDRLDPAVFSIVNNVSPKLLHHRDPKIYGPLTVRA